MATDSATVTMESLYTTIALSNGAIADPLRPPPKWGFHMPPKYANGRICATCDPIHFMFGSIQGRRVEWRYFRFSGYIKSKLAAGRPLG